MNTTSMETSAGTAWEDLSGLAAKQCTAEAERERAARAEAERVRREGEAKQRAAVEREAQELITLAFPLTLAQVVTAQMWRGYPSGQHYERPGQAPMAIAPLGDSVWLCVEDHGDYGAEVSLLHPCPCGAYATIPLHGELHLAYLRVALDEAPVQCASSCPTAHR